MKRLIALTGFKGCGKSTVAGFLEAHGYKRMGFAGPLKEMLEVLGVPKANLYGSSKEQPLKMLGGATGRHAMQTLGTEWGRQLIWGELWTETLYRRASIELGLSKDNKIVVDDLRFHNEQKVIERLGGEVWRINRIKQDNKDAHLSEASIARIKPSRYISNQKGLKALEKEVEKLFQKKKGEA